MSVPPNTGDVAVPCQTPEFSQTVYGEPWTCDYTLDVTGGWYDAGDHGKYVVNGGISVAQLMSTWERNQNARFTDRQALDDSTLPLPERVDGARGRPQLHVQPTARKKRRGRLRDHRSCGQG